MSIHCSHILASFFTILVLSSCVSRKQLTYLQYSNKSEYNDLSGSELRTSPSPTAYRIMPHDNLYIRVITPDPQWSDIFNVDAGTSGLTQESATLLSYSVAKDGSIELPYIGKVQVSGNTLTEVKVELDSIFKNYVTDGEITVKLVNNTVSIIGEVTAPGKYLIYKDCINIFEALSLARDLTPYGDRQKVQLIRPSPYGPIIKEFSLADRSILTSEFYYILPNDIIVVLPTQGRSFLTNTTVFSLFLTTITTALVIISYFQVL